MAVKNVVQRKRTTNCLDASQRDFDTAITFAGVLRWTRVSVGYSVVRSSGPYAHRDLRTAFLGCLKAGPGGSRPAQVEDPSRRRDNKKGSGWGGRIRTALPPQPIDPLRKSARRRHPEKPLAALGCYTGLSDLVKRFGMLSPRSGVPPRLDSAQRAISRFIVDRTSPGPGQE